MDIIKYEDLTRYEKGLDKRLTINGESKVYPSYKFPISLLYYNDLNGRIATCIEEYNDTHECNIAELKSTNINKYNDIISEYIIDSALDGGKSFKETKDDIMTKGQEIPGVILSDGRIIDGNRRFTALRKLYGDTGNPSFSFFEAVWLKAPEKEDSDGWKTIKSLELNLQFNVDEKKGYNRIDELVSFYRDVMDEKTKMFDEKAYCYASGLSTTKFNNNKRIVEIMLDYLVWRDKPKCFYILKNEKLDGPIEELAKTAKTMSEEEWNEKKDTLYTFMTIVDKGDRTRNIRDLLKSSKEEGALYNHIKDILETPYISKNVVEYISVIDKTVTTIEDTNHRNHLKTILKDNIQEAFNDGKYLENENITNKGPIIAFEKAINLLRQIDLSTVRHLTDSVSEELADKISCIKDVIEGIENARKK